MPEMLYKKLQRQLQLELLPHGAWRLVSTDIEIEPHANSEVDISLKVAWCWTSMASSQKCPLQPAMQRASSEHLSVMWDSWCCQDALEMSIDALPDTDAPSKAGHLIPHPASDAQLPQVLEERSMYLRRWSRMCQIQGPWLLPAGLKQ